MSRRKTSGPTSNFLTPSLAAAAAVGAAAASFAAAAGGLLGWDDVPAPFAWTDVALVQFLCSLPLAAAIAAWIRPRSGAVHCFALGSACFVAAAALWSAGTARSMIVLGAATGAMLLIVPWLRPGENRDVTGKNAAAIALLDLAIMIGLPWVYLAARSNHDSGQLAELLEQSRIGEAHELAGRMLALDPQQPFQGQPLKKLSANLDRAVREMESRVTAPLPPSAGDEAHLARARDLAILGRTAAALATLDQAASLADSPDGLLLRGTIYQTRQEWLPSADAFRRAAKVIESLPLSPERTVGLITAASGVAFAERKLGHNAAAETAYEQVLKLDPSADTHYLLAQFYEGTQQAAKAQHHARQAMSLAPDRFQQPGQRLIDKLVTHHFGCWGAAAAERHE
jgi:tetratricopeptide (TPR) repeat protein